MADNYLEKKYEEWKNGKPAVKRTVPSLETLLKRLGESSGPDLQYTVKQAQIDAIIRAGKLVDDSLEFISDEASSTVSVAGTGPFILGQAVMAMKLKAAELRLQAETSQSPSSGTDEKVMIKISKGL